MGCFEVSDKYENCLNRISNLQILINNTKKKINSKQSENNLKKIEDEKFEIMKEIKILNIQSIESDEIMKFEFINEQFQLCLNEIDNLNFIIQNRQNQNDNNDNNKKNNNKDNEEKK